MPRQKSRPARWAEAVEKAKAALSKVEDAKAELVESLSGLEEIRAEYEEWRDSFPENAQSSTTYEMLEAVVELDLSEEDDITAMIECVEAVENVELPRGYGRD